MKLLKISILLISLLFTSSLFGKDFNKLYDIFNNTLQTISMLDSNKTDKAGELLDNMLKDMKPLVKDANPDDRVAIVMNANIIEYGGSIEDIKRSIKEVKRLMNVKRYQDARLLLSTLRSDIEFLTYDFPIVIYYNFLKDAKKSYSTKDYKGTSASLYNALSSIQSYIIIESSDLIKAQNLIDDINRLSEEDIVKNRQLILDSISLIRYYLNRAEALGYTSKSDITYTILNESLNRIEADVKSDKYSKLLYENLLKKIKEFNKESKTKN